jgi:hypothetical protein
MVEALPLLTLALTPRNGEAIKPAELIQITGHHELTLNARRAITILWYHAHKQGVEVGKDYTVEIDQLRSEGHRGYQPVVEAIESLMRSILTIRHADGSTVRVQFLGGNNLDSPDRTAGILTYSFDKRLIEVIRDSTIWGKIAIPILMAFTSKYSVSLYENAAQFSGLTFKNVATYTLDEFRAMIGVPQKKYKSFGELNKHVLKPAVAEVNALAPFGIALLPVKEGKRVVAIKMGWWKRDEGGEGMVLEPALSVERAVRQARRSAKAASRQDDLLPQYSAGLLAQGFHISQGR